MRYHGDVASLPVLSQVPRFRAMFTSTSKNCCAIVVCAVWLIGCETSPANQVIVNQDSGLSLPKPEFLQSRAILSNNLEAQISAEVEGIIYRAERTREGFPWVGELYIPEDSDAELTVEWVELNVPGLPDELEGELLLASYTTTITGVDENRAFEIQTEQYTTQGTLLGPRPDLDIDGDGVSNLVERQANSRPNDAQDKPSRVTLNYSPNAPIIDGQFDSLWGDSAQFLDNDRNALNIDKLMLDTGVTEPGESRQYKWAGMHDGRYLYLMIFGEVGDQQTPYGDSELTYNDDAVDVFWDGNNSKSLLYDGVDDFHVLIPLLGTDSVTANSSGNSDISRFEFAANSVSTHSSIVEFAVCLCDGEQQIYEVKIDLELAMIPVDTTFGFEIQLNNDVNGGQRDAKWAWFDDSGGDNTWRFPFRMGTARLEALPD